MKLSVILPVYNEERILPFALETMLPYVDQCIIIDGSEEGPSTDGTTSVIHKFMGDYPGVIEYLQGIFRTEDGALDDTANSNLGFEHADGDFIMRTHADIVYEHEDMEKILDALVSYPQKRYFYCPMIQFCWDTQHVLLPSVLKAEDCLHRDMCGDVVVLSRDTNPRFEQIGKWSRSSLVTDPIDWFNDTLLLHGVNRYHFGWVKPFQAQVDKILCYIAKGDYEEEGERLQAMEGQDLQAWASERVLEYSPVTHPQVFPYYGPFPKHAAALRDMRMLEGY